MVPQSSHFESNLNLLSSVKRIQGLNIDLKIGFFFTDIIGRDDLQQLFEWLWNHRIINVFVAFGGRNVALLNVYNFDPFGTFELINVTGSESFNKIFPAERSNFHYHPFRIAAINDSSIAQYSSNVPFLGGPDENLWKIVFSTMNATYSIFWVSGSFARIENLDNGTVDIFGDLTDIVDQGIITIYPIVKEILSIVVPKSKQFEAFTVFIKASASSNFLGYTLLMILVAVVADVVSLLLNANSAIKYQRLCLSEVFLVIPMTFAGFLIANGFLSLLKSHHTRLIMQPQIETIEDLYKSPIPMTSPNEYWLNKDAEMLNSLLKHGNLSVNMQIINNFDYEQQILMEVPFAFAEYDSVAQFVNIKSIR